MPVLVARGPQRKRLRATLTLAALIPLMIVVAACSDNDASTNASQQSTQQKQQHQQALATSFNADASPPDSQPAANASLHTPQFSTAHAQSAPPGGASAADSVVLAPPVIHTVD